MKKAIPTLIGLAVLIGLGAGLNAILAGPAKGPQEDPGTPGGQRVLSVVTTPLRWQDSLTVPRRFTGSITARRTADIAFEGSGRVISLEADEGDEVAANATLGTLDRRDLEARRDEVVARRAGLIAQLEELQLGPRKESIDAARSSVEAIEEQLKLAQLQRDRRRELAAKGTISAEQLDTTEAAVKEIAARLAAGRAELAELENGTRPETLRAQEGALAEVDAALASVDIALDKTILRSPFDGQVERRFLDEGTVVSQQMPTAAFRIVESGALEARVGLPPNLASRVQSDPSSVQLLLHERALTFKGLKVLPTVAPGTRTVEVLMELDRRSAEQAGARPGDTVSLLLETERSDRGAWIPLGALTESARGLWSAFAVTASADSPSGFVASRVELEVLSANETRAFVRGTFDSGLDIVAAGVGRLVPGQAIRPMAKEEQEERTR